MDYSIPLDALRTAAEIFPFEIGGERVYVKKRRPNKHALGKWVQGALFRVFPHPLVLPSGQPAGGNVAFEAATLRRMAGHGVAVPRVLHETADYFVMSDTGESLQRILRKTADQDERDKLVALAARALRRLHDTGQAHGGALIRNMTIRDGVLHFIDFEEDVPAAHLEQYQLRDLFLFVFSLARNRLPVDARRVCGWYDAPSPSPDVPPDGPTWPRLRAALLRLRLVRVAEWRALRGIKMSDIRTLAALVRQAGEGN